MPPKPRPCRRPPGSTRPGPTRTASSRVAKNQRSTLQHKVFAFRPRRQQVSYEENPFDGYDFELDELHQEGMGVQQDLDSTLEESGEPAHNIEENAWNRVGDEDEGIEQKDEEVPKRLEEATRIIFKTEDQKISGFEKEAGVEMEEVPESHVLMELDIIPGVKKEEMDSVQAGAMVPASNLTLGGSSYLEVQLANPEQQSSITRRDYEDLLKEYRKKCVEVEMLRAAMVKPQIKREYAFVRISCPMM